MGNKNDVVLIQLDRPRELRFGHKALKTLQAMTEKTLEELEQNVFNDFELIEKFVYCGLLYDARQNREILKLEDMEDLLDQAPSYKHIIESVEKAYFAAMGIDPNELGKQSQPEAPASENQ